MKKAIELLSRLIECEVMVFTGSFALNQVGLMDKVKDLDVIIVKPSPDSLKTLSRLHIPYHKTGYPEDPSQFRVQIEGKNVDIFCKEKMVDFIEIKYHNTDIKISKMPSIIKAKRSFNRLKDLLQLKIISEKFYTPKDLEIFLTHEQNKYD